MPAPPTSATYASFLPGSRAAAAALEPEETWWGWEGCRVRLARARRPGSRVRLLVVHGAGGHGDAVWPLAALLAGADLDVTTVDLPLYGRTTVPDPVGVRYEDWVRLLEDLVRAEDDGRPLVLLGASIGGMLAREVAARSPHVAAVAATCLVDPRALRVRARVTRFGPLGVLAGPLSALARGPVARVGIPIAWVAHLSRMSRDPRLSALCASDPRGGGTRVPLGFLASWLRYRHVPGDRLTVPLLLAHPSHDTWTPPRLSMPQVEQHAGPATVVLLRECGHYPVEEPGLGDLLTAVRALATAAAPSADGNGTGSNPF